MGWETEQLKSDATHAIAVIDRMLLVDGLGSDTVLQLIDLRQRFILYSFSGGWDWTMLGGDYRRIDLIDRVLALGYLKPELSHRVVRLQNWLMRDLSSARFEVIPSRRTDPSWPTAHEEHRRGTKSQLVPVGQP